MEIVTAAGAIRLRPETAGDADFRFGLFCLSRALEWAALASALVHSLPEEARRHGGRWVLMSRAPILARKSSIAALVSQRMAATRFTHK
jgi:hypothetical protein